MFSNCNALNFDQHKEIHLIDDFYRDPMAIRQQALVLDYSPSDHYPGMRTPKQEIDGPIKKLLEARIGKPIIKLETLFQYQSAEFEHPSFIHGDLCDYAGVLYLNPDSQDRPGTNFYRHKASGISQLPLGADLMFAAIAQNKQPNEVLEPFNDDRLDEQKWQLSLSVPAVFNRLVFYNAKLFHRNASAWGTTIEDARLVQGFFAYTQSSDGPNRARVDHS